MGLQEVKLPPDLPNWSLVKTLLQELQTRLNSQNITDQETGWYMQTIYTTIQSDQPVSASCSNPISRLVQSVYSSFHSRSPAPSPLSRLKSQIQSNFKKKLDPECVWYGMMKYMKSVSKNEREHFLYLLLPGIIHLALEIEENRPPGGLYLSRKQNSGSTAVSRQFVCSIVAGFFLCLFPERKRETSPTFNIINFTTFFRHLQLPSQVSKLRCLLHYFECIIERGLRVQGSIVVTRKSIKSEWMLDFDQLTECDVNLCPLTVLTEGNIEDSAPHAIQVDFANQSLGGGVLGKGRVQEEIKFCVCPELLSVLLFMESMDANEAVSVSGFEQFSCYRGYADSFEFAGHYNGQMSKKRLRMVAIDAMSYREFHPMKQYEETYVMRDLNKALIGFCRVTGSEDSLLVEEVETKSEIDTEVVAPSLEADEQISENVEISRECKDLSVESLAEDVHSQSSIDQSPDSTDSIDYCPLVDGGGSAAADHSQTFRSQPPAFISGIIHGNVSCLRVSPLSILSSVSHIVPQQPVSSSHSAGSCNILQPAIHSSDSQTVPVVNGPGAEPSGPHEKVSDASQVHCLSEPYGTLVSKTSPASCSSQNSCGSSLNDLTAVGPTPRLSSALAKPSVLSSDTSSFPLNESGFQSLEQTAISHSHSFSESADRLHKWEFDILGNLTKVFSAKVVRVSLSEGLSSSVDGSSFTMYDLNPGPVKTLESGQNMASANQPASFSALDEKRDEPLNSVTYDEKGLLESSIYSDKMCSSLEANVDSHLVETDSLGKEQNELYISVEDNDFQYNLPEDAGIVGFDSTHLEPTSSISPHSSASSANISPLSSFTLPSACYPEPLNGSHDVHMSADFFIPGLGDVREQHHRESKELQAELREFLSSYSSGSRSSGSGPYSSNNSTWGSRSGSISSHGTNGSSNDFIEFWNHFRRRSSQLSDNTSRRSSSSKHSSDFSTDLEEISESFQKHDHGVIEEEGGVMTLLTDCATQIVSTTMKSAVSGPECQDEACIQDLASKTETVSSAVSRTGKPRRTFTRAGTLVRQEKVTQEQEDMCSVESKVTESSSSEGPNEEKRIDSSFGGMQHTLTPPKPAAYTSFISAPSSISSPLQSIDSGFISVQAMASASKESDSVPSRISTALSTELPPESIGSQSMGQSMESTVLVGDLSQRQEKWSQDLSAVASVQCLTEGRASSTLPKFHPSKSIFGPDKTRSRHAVKTEDPIHSTLQLTQTESQSLVEAADMKALKEKSPVKSRSSRLPEKLAKTTCPKPGKETKHSASREAAAASVSPSSTDSVSHMSSGASGPSRSSGIPKIKSSPKKSGHSDKHIILHPSHAKSKMPEKLEASSAEKERAKVQKNKRSIIKERAELSAKPLKSRYVFSDVAAPPSERKQKHKDSPHKKSGRSSSRSLEDKRKSKQRLEEKEVHHFTKSPRFIRFVNSLAEISLSQAVLEGAEMLSQPNLGQEEISDEVYTWFANKIISEVFSHVIGEIESREFLLSQNSPSNLGEIGASGDLMSQAEGMIGDYENPPLGASSREPATVGTGTARPKTKSILPQRSDTAASSARIIASQGLQRSSGSLKMVKFKEEDPKKLTEQQATFQAPIINNIPLRRRSSLDLPLVPPPSSRVPIDLLALPAALPRAPEQRRRSLTGADLSVNIYQAAASIVNQVFQNISDSMMETQALSPGSSSCYHGTVSSSDTGAHSTGSRIHIHYDSFTSNIFSSSSTKASESPRRARRSVSPSIGVFFRKPMSRETLTSAYLKVDHSPQIKSYERRSSEPCQTSVQLSLQAFNNNKFNGRAWEEKKKISRTDDDIGRGKTWRRGSLDGFSFDQRRNSCGFKDPVLSRFAEELMKADTSVPELVIVGSHASSSSTGSRRSSVSAFRDSTLANLENELLNTSFTSGCSMSSRSQRHLDRSRSRDSRQGKSDSSDTEYWFPPPKFVGDEFQLEYNRQHSQDELQ
ncbi:poly(ADP-ribose) glycohydrolase, partial [Biomphalaria glabrata]